MIKDDKNKFILYLLGLGVFLLISGLVYVVYDHWEIIPKLIQATFALLIPIIPLGIGLYFKNKENLKIIGNVSSLVSILAIPISIGLISNIYQLMGNFLNLLLIWVLISTPIVFYFLFRLNSYVYFVVSHFLIYCILLSLYWNTPVINFSFFESKLSSYGLLISSFFISFFTGIILFVLYKNNFLKKNFDEFFKPLMNVSLFFFLVFGFFLSWYSRYTLFGNSIDIILNFLYLSSYILGLAFLVNFSIEKLKGEYKFFLMSLLTLICFIKVFITISNTSIAILISGILLIGLGFFLYVLNNKGGNKKK